MQVWRRRVAVLLAVGAGSAGLMMSSAGAQTSPPGSIPNFPTFPTFPPFPTFPSIPPPPTMPPPTSPPPTSPPPTMPPPTSPPSTPDINAIVDDLLDRIADSFEQGQVGFEEIQQIIDDIRAGFFG